jgi:ElaA protein
MEANHRTNDPENTASGWSWNCLPFHELAVEDLYVMLRLRSEVFVVEQQCIFLDMDDKDRHCLHILGWIDGILGASARILPPGLAYPEASIGRVVSSPLVRRTGGGRLLMKYAIRETRRIHGDTDIRIGAQLYLKDFYSSFGFREEGEIYLEDGIPHVEMLLKA